MSKMPTAFLSVAIDRHARGADLLAEDRQRMVGQRIDVGHVRVADHDVRRSSDRCERPSDLPIVTITVDVCAGFTSVNLLICVAPSPASASPPKRLRAPRARLHTAAAHPFELWPCMVLHVNSPPLLVSPKIASTTGFASSPPSLSYVKISLVPLRSRARRHGRRGALDRHFVYRSRFDPRDNADADELRFITCCVLD